MCTYETRAAALVPRHSLFLHNAVRDTHAPCMYGNIRTSYRLHEPSLVGYICGENMSLKRFPLIPTSESLFPLFEPASLLNIK